jgi:SAM-dependent methyltransferase
MDVNGSIRPLVQALAPHSYLGVDIEPGPGVDEICDATDLLRRYGRDSFDVVIATELVEHVWDWRRAFANLKGVLAPGGLMLITTRSHGYPYHEAPHDFWRYELEDMRQIFRDMDITALEADPSMPGVFVKASKPAHYRESSLDDVDLFSVISDRRERRLAWLTQTRHRIRSTRHPRGIALSRVRRLVPAPIRRWIRSNLLNGRGRASDP